MYNNLCIHSSVDRHLGCFHVLAIVNSAEIKNGYNTNNEDKYNTWQKKITI